MRVYVLKEMYLFKNKRKTFEVNLYDTKQKAFDAIHLKVESCMEKYRAFITDDTDEPWAIHLCDYDSNVYVFEIEMKEVA